jgi:REP element-mobilizing transposase RayT
MVVGHHLIWTAYGWWLPNDPRGSSSDEIRVERIADLGELHQGRKTVQPSSTELRCFYQQAQVVLKHPLLTFSDLDIGCIGQALGQVIRQRGWTCYACALMPDHVHLLIRRHRDPAEVMLESLQDGSRQAVIEAGRRSATHPVWGGPGWKVFKSSRPEMERTVRYIEANPIKACRPAQSWPFVTKYDGWMPRYRG